MTPVMSWSLQLQHLPVLILCHLLILSDPGVTAGVNFSDTKLNIMSLPWSFPSCFSRFAKACPVPLVLTLRRLLE